MPRHRGSSTSIDASTAGAYALGLLVVAAPLARGGVHLPVQLAAAGLAAVALLLLSRGTDRAPWAALPLLLVLGWSALQVLPLGGGQAVSLDPPASGRALASAAAALLAFAAAWAVAGTRRRREIVLVALGASGLAVAFVVLGAALLGLGPLLEPKFPFVNPNHLAGFLALTAFPVLGLALRRHGQARLLWLMGFVVVVAPLFLSLSRGGIGAFFGGVAVFLLLAARRERPDGEPPHPWRWAALAGLTAALGAVAYLALEPVVRELSTLRTARDDVKLELWRPAFTLIRERPFTGIGRGAFETVFPALKTDPAAVTFTHLENEWLQPLVDLGVPAGLLLVGTLGLGWLAAARRRDLSSVEVGLLAGTAAVAAQNLVDFSLEFSGVGVPFMVALGLLTRGAGPVRLRGRWLAGGAAAICGVALAGALLWRAHPTDQEASAVASAPTAAEAAVLASEAMRWHRADYLPAAAVRLSST
jgi:O-antigen ligase